MSGATKIVKDSFFGGAEKEAGKVQERASLAAGRQFTQAREDITEAVRPFVETGREAFDIQAGLVGARGAEEEQRQLNAFAESPGQAFLRERGEKALLRNTAAIGGLGGGNIRKALTEFGIGTAAQQFQQRLANLGSITEIGQRGLTQQLQGIQFGAGGQAQGLIGAGLAKAQGITGRAAGIRSGITTAASLAAGLPPPGSFGGGGPVTLRLKAGGKGEHAEAC